MLLFNYCNMSYFKLYVRRAPASYAQEVQESRTGKTYCRTHRSETFCRVENRKAQGRNPPLGPIGGRRGVPALAIGRRRAGAVAPCVATPPRSSVQRVSLTWSVVWRVAYTPGAGDEKITRTGSIKNIVDEIIVRLRVPVFVYSPDTPIYELSNALGFQ